MQQRLVFLRGTAPATVKPATNDWLLEGITNELRRRGLWMRAHPIPKNLLPDGYEAKAAHIQKYLIKGCGEKRLKSISMMVLGQVAASSLADYLLRARVPVSPKTLLNNIDKIPAAIDASFPGYWAAAALSVCAKARSK